MSLESEYKQGYSEGFAKGYEQALEFCKKDIDYAISILMSNIPKSSEDVYRGTSIKALNLSSRAYNRLIRRDIKTVDQLMWQTEADLLRIRGFGKGCLKELNDALHRHGCNLAI